MLDSAMIRFARSICSFATRSDIPQLAEIARSVGITAASTSLSNLCAAMAACGESNANRPYERFVKG